MRNRTLNGIPVIDDFQTIDKSTLEAFLKKGICYVSKNIARHTSVMAKELNLDAANFFRKSTDEKKKCSAYSDRRTAELKELSERLSFPASHPPDEMKASFAGIQTTRVELQENIVTPLLLKIFQHYEITMSGKFIDDDGAYLSFVHYPYDTATGGIGLKKHKDLGLLTVLLLNERGLKLRDDKTLNTWLEIEPHPDYYVVICGKALQLMLGKDKCHAPSHYVELRDEKRLTMGMFYNPQATAPVKNIFTGEEIFKSFFPDYVTSTLAKYR